MRVFLSWLVACVLPSFLRLIAVVIERYFEGCDGVDDGGETE